ncbi:hypothetical protein V8G54_033611 [Vigna mungo]|uniref:Uncharacterized protein n=1 Tax=Vigna mungo TaxID=3915 RepID=A0AAQ3MPD4_VIGMU
MAKRDLETGGGRTKNNKTEENYTAHESSNLYEADTHWTSWLVPMFMVANIENSLLGLSSSTLTEMGALWWDNAGNEHQGWRLDTCIWLHAGIIDLLAIMLSLQPHSDAITAEMF